MKKIAATAVLSACLVLALFLGPEASPLGTAADFNVFVFGDIVQYGTDVEGRVAGGGNVTYGKNEPGKGFAIGRNVPNQSGPPELVAGGNVTLANGSVGWLDPKSSGNAASQKGEIVYGGTAAIATDGGGYENVGYGSKSKGQPIDFAAERNYLANMSGFWGGLAPTGKTEILKNASNEIYAINLTGQSSELNIFSLDAAFIKKNLGFNFSAPLESTVLVNITGKDVELMNFGFYFNGIKGDEDHGTGYPFANILFNFLDAKNIAIDGIEINGSILAPWADIEFFKGSHIDGQLIAQSLFGEGEAHNIRFDGNLPTAPVPEPATLILLGTGLAGAAAWRRRRR